MCTELKHPVVLPSDTESATPITFNGWKSRTGRVFADEGAARYDGATHIPCKGCNNPAAKPYLLCPDCLQKKRNLEYEQLPFLEWDGETPLALYNSDQYFFSEDEVSDFCDEHEIQVANLQLVICVPKRFSQLNLDQWLEDLPEDVEDLPEGLVLRVEQLNQYIDTLHEAGWIPGKVRTNIVL